MSDDVNGKRVADVFQGKCAMCSHWTGARITGVVDEGAMCISPKMMERFDEQEGEPGWYETPCDYSCEFYELMDNPFSIEDDGCVKLELPMLNLLSEIRALGLGDDWSLEEAFEEIKRRIDENMEYMEVPG